MDGPVKRNQQEFVSPSNVPAIVDDIRLKLRALEERIAHELPAHFSLHNAKERLREAIRALSEHPSQRKGNERSHPNLAEQTDANNLEAAGQLPPGPPMPPKPPADRVG